jgi:hypothetical protein
MRARLTQYACASVGVHHVFVECHVGRNNRYGGQTADVCQDNDVQGIDGGDQAHEDQ